MIFTLHVPSFIRRLALALSPAIACSLFTDSYNAVAYGGYLYVIGGELVGTPIPDVQYAKIRSDGKLDPFKSTTPVTVIRHSHCAYGVVGR